jgi:hypothetical protein
MDCESGLLQHQAGYQDVRRLVTITRT